jgi:hypothetical protein
MNSWNSAQVASGDGQELTAVPIWEIGANLAVTSSYARVEKLIEHRRRNRVHHQRIAVWRGTCGGIGADGAAGTAAIVDENLLAELVGQMFRGDASDHVGRPACRERNDEADGLCWIGLGQRRGRSDSAEAVKAKTLAVDRFRKSRRFSSKLGAPIVPDRAIRKSKNGFTSRVPKIVYGYRQLLAFNAPHE